ncbi:putative BTB/POZ domain and WD-repeat protein [Cotonvirus japonicus]|uniref:BTB/POZ domain and WD-repeat protein n=1 Tax=Cotonvirus japonicus TaxID=2811091 RepID=A0ABM7NSN5_9VIRU|nr:putative BTB/POZ domain and WD-repeat protein [Cotonvirus japonicus]BCS83126.1 putative BTB/POZ domain and WD-repeat protein [Cotonvirus japonicus]
MEPVVGFSHYLESEQYSDLVLILKDSDGNSIKMNVHKVIVSSRCPLIRQILNSEFREAHDSIITLNLPNILIGQDVIWSIYDKYKNSGNYEHHQKYLLEIECLDYLQMPYDFHYQRLLDIGIPEQDFAFATNIITRFNYNIDIDIISRILKNNLPSEGDLSCIPKKIMDKIINLSRIQRVIRICGNKIRVENFDNKVVKRINLEIKPEKLLIIFGYQIVVAGLNTKIQIYNFFSGEKIGELDHDVGVDFLCCSPNGKYIIIGKNDYSNSKSSIYIYNSITKQFKFKLEILSIINALTCSSNYIAVSSSNDIHLYKYLWNIETESHVIYKCLTGTGHVNFMKITPNETRLILFNIDRGTIKIWNLESIENLEIFYADVGYGSKQIFYNLDIDNEYIYFFNYNKKDTYGFKYCLNKKTKNTFFYGAYQKYVFSEKIIAELKYTLRREKHKKKYYNIKDHVFVINDYDNKSVQNYILNDI